MRCRSGVSPEPRCSGPNTPSTGIDTALGKGGKVGLGMESERRRHACNRGGLVKTGMPADLQRKGVDCWWRGEGGWVMPFCVSRRMEWDPVSCSRKGGHETDFSEGDVVVILYRISGVLVEELLFVNKHPFLGTYEECTDEGKAD